MKQEAEEAAVTQGELGETAKAAPEPEKKLADIKTFKTKRDKEKLLVQLTEDELRNYGDQLAKTERRRTSMEIEAANTSKRMKAEIGLQVAEIARLAELVEKKEELRDVPVEIQYHKPYHGEKTIVRLDTMEIVRTDIMPTYEKEDLLLDAAEKQADGEDELILDIPESKPNEKGVFEKYSIVELFEAVKGLRAEIHIVNAGGGMYAAGGEYVCYNDRGSVPVNELVASRDFANNGIRETVAWLAAKLVSAPVKFNKIIAKIEALDDDKLLDFVRENIVHENDQETEE